MNCPKCNAAMEPVTFEAVTVDRCTGCKGIWFDANEQKKLVEVQGSDAIDIGDARQGHKMNKITAINCPKCNAPMVEKVDVDQHHIHFEACESCQGIYLDAGEFKDLKHYNLMDYLRGLFRHRTPKKK